jgi:uncharacterized repeat protein (TIGR01451 family)
MPTRPPGHPTLDLTTAGSFGFIDDVVFETALDQPAGTGNFDTFEQIQHNGIEQGYNTDGTKQFDTKTSAGFNHSVLLAQVPIVVGDGSKGTVDGAVYREFRLDLNEPNGGTNPFLSLDRLQIWQEEAGNLTGFTPGAGFSGAHTNNLVYNLDTGGDNWVGLNAALSHGSGQSDLAVLIPDSSFINNGSDRFVYLYSEFGVQSGWDAGGGFEEWGLSTPNGPNVATNALAISKTVSIPTQDHGTADRAGEVLSYTIHVDNVGNTTLTHLSVTDPAASGLAPVVSGGFNVGDTNHDGVFSPGESWVYTAFHTVTQADLDNNGDGDGLITNTAIAQTDQTGPQSATVSTPVVHNTGLAVTKSPDVTSVDAAGAVINYVIAVTNTGTVAQTVTSVTDTDVQTVTPIVDIQAPIVDLTKPVVIPILIGDYNVGDINQNGIQDPGETFQFSNLGDTNQNGIVDPGETWVFANVGDTNQNGQQDPGETFQYYNAGDTNHNGVQDPGETFQFFFDHTASPVTSGGFNVGDTNHDGAINPGGTWHYSASYTLTQTDIDNGGALNPALAHTNDGTVSTDQTSLTTSASVSIVQDPRLTIAKSADVASVHAAGDVIHYTVTLGNAGNMTLTGITVSDPLVTNLVYASGDANSDGKLDLTETWTYTGSHAVTQAEIDNGGIVDPALKITNTATADSAQTDPQTASTSVLVAQNPHMTLTKGASLADGGAAADNAGDVIKYTIALANDGNMTLTHPTVSDPSVSDLAPVMAGGFNAGDTNHDGKLSVGETWQYTADHTVTQAEIDNGGVVDPALAISNTASAATDQGASASATASVSVAQNPGLTLAKAGTFNDTNADGFANPGETITYTFTETNTGNMTLHNVTVSDQGSGVTVSGSPIASLAPGASDGTTYTGTYTITQADIDAGFKDNTAGAASDNATSAPATAHVVLPQNAHMGLSETVSDPNSPSSAGDPLLYTFSLTNDGNVTLQNPMVIDAVATGITLEQIGPDIVGDANHNGQFDVGETWMWDGSYTLTAADITNGSVQNMANATALGPQGQMASATSSFIFHTT